MAQFAVDGKADDSPPSGVPERPWCELILVIWALCWCKGGGWGGAAAATGGCCCGAGPRVDAVCIRVLYSDSPWRSKDSASSPGSCKNMQFLLGQASPRR